MSHFELCAIIIPACCFVWLFFYAVCFFCCRNAGEAILKRNNSYFVFLILTILEEIIARWLFMEVLPKHYLFQDQIWLCMVVGSLGWLFFAENNFFNIRNYVSIIPHFLTSIGYAVIFLNDGLFASIMSHLTVNSFNMLFDYVEDRQHYFKNLLIILLCFTYLNILIFSYKPGLLIGAIYSTLACIFLGRIITSFVFIDQSNSLRIDGRSETPPKLEYLFLGILLLLFIVSIIFVTLFFAIPSLEFRALLLTLFLCIFGTHRSGNSRARNFWNTFVPIYVFTCLVNIESLLVCVLAFMALYLPILFIERVNYFEHT